MAALSEPEETQGEKVQKKPNEKKIRGNWKGSVVARQTNAFMREDTGKREEPGGERKRGSEDCWAWGDRRENDVH